ncbi:sulfite exporter TauE/SafE family protein [Phaeobacter sp.]|uniref:sulfite exporter TauE/SafE family protein n=1 Tax=Phaeobacter sp. TaxID=1902409 RepID=UPI0025D43008|nr:sulfite exporter TauE/SafE family protein [Phaeobacter sp.]
MSENYVIALFLPADLDVVNLWFAFAIAVLAGLVKGLVGFAMPMILVSGLSLFLPPEIALAGLIFPTFVTNGMQALRQGAEAAWQSIKRFRIFLLVGLVFLLFSAQFVRVFPADVMLIVLGTLVTTFALLQLFGLAIPIRAATTRVEATVAAIAGFIGGFSGIWGPPTVAYLTALGTEKKEQMRVQGVIYGLGAVALLVAHLGSGVMRAETAPFSMALVPPAILGMWCGSQLQDRINQHTFRRATLIVLLIAGANLLRRGLVM